MKILFDLLRILKGFIYGFGRILLGITYIFLSRLGKTIIHIAFPVLSLLVIGGVLYFIQGLGKLPFYIGDIFGCIYIFLLYKSFCDIFFFWLRYGTKKNLRQLIFPFTLIDFEIFGYRSSWLEYVAGACVYQLIRPILVLILGRWWVSYVGKRILLLGDQKPNEFDENMIDFIRKKRSDSSYISYSINNVLVTLFIAVIGFFIALLSVSDGKLFRLYAFSQIENYVSPITDYFKPTNVMRGFECKGFVKVSSQTMNGIEKQCLGKPNIMGIKLDRNAGICQEEAIREQMSNELRKYDNSISIKDISYIHDDPYYEKGIVVFETTTDFDSGAVNTASIYGGKCQKYDIDNYLSDKMLIIILALLIFVSMGFVFLISIPSIIITILNADRYLSRKYYDYLIDITIIDKLK